MRPFELLRIPATR